MPEEKFSTTYTRFERELDILCTLDGQNQERYRKGPGRSTTSILTTSQIHIINEGVFSRAFRNFEVFVEEAFVLYVSGKLSRSGKRPVSYLSPKSSEHAIDLMQSGMTFLEWNSPENIISRAELYLKDGFPVKDAFTSNLTLLKEARHIRNHIAHNSQQSQRKYSSVLRRAFTTMPTKIYSPGEFLQMSDRSKPAQHFLLTYLNGFRTVADQLTN